MKALAPALFCALGLQGGPDASIELPPRRPVAGMHGFQAVSRLTYAAQPDRPHRLEVRYQFPARARWNIEAEVPTLPEAARRAPETEGASSRRVLEYRIGTRGFQVLPGRLLSVELAPADVQALAGRTELRRVAMLWPDGLDWQPRPGDADTHLLAASLAGPSGTLAFEAHLDEDERPRSFVLLDAKGNENERLDVTGWSERDGRTWPAGFAFFAGGAPVWHETVERVGQAYFLDLVFLPPDRRPQVAAADVEGTEVRAVDLVPCVYRRHAFDQPLAWEEGLRRSRVVTRKANETLAAALDPRPTLEIDRRGRVTGFLVRLAGEETAAPEGWSRSEERPGLLTRFQDPAGLPRRLEALRRRIPAGTTGGVPYVRVYQGAWGEPWLELALPLHPAR